MTGPLHNRIEEAFAELQNAQAAIAGAQETLAGSTSSFTTHNRALTVTVDSQGRLTEVVFHTGAYRSMAPAELGTLLVEAARAAQDDAAQSAMATFQAVMPGNGMLDHLFSGSLDLDEMVQEAVRTAGSPFPGEPGFRAPKAHRRQQEEDSDE